MPRPLNLFYSTLIVIAASSILCGCAAIPRLHENTLNQIYAKKRKEPHKTPEIFIHGILGSVLEDPATGRVIWGRSFEGSMEKLRLPVTGAGLAEDRDNLRAVDIVEYFSWFGFLKKDIYYRAEKVVANMGYVPERDAFALLYDWRRDLAETAAQLDKLIIDIRKKTGRSDLKFTLVCHSMGGMVARYYIKYGGVDVLDQDPLPAPTYAGAKNIDRVIMLGVPNCGSMEAFERLHEGLSIPTIGSASPEVAFTMPALYYLMPFGSKPLFINPKGEPLDIDLYDPANWEKYGWSVFNPDHLRSEQERLSRKYNGNEAKQRFESRLDEKRKFLKLVLGRARKFHDALWAGDPAEEREHIEYVLFGSDSQPTLQKGLMIQDGSRWRTAFNAQAKSVKDMLYGPGDGSVTRASLLGVELLRMPSAYEVFIAERHTDLTDDPTYLDNILHILLDK